MTSGHHQVANFCMPQALVVQSAERVFLNNRAEHTNHQKTGIKSSFEPPIRWFNLPPLVIIRANGLKKR